ncbi:MAG: Multidrug resistance protein NorM [Firmicutes bacterium ADurb.Bin182]|nr:MAG: Multidrug resistance protein NorM [Firmicutes bacterium ADurb.Bin182]
MVNQFIKRIFNPKYMIKPSLLKGGLPTAREAYGQLLTLAWPAALEGVLVSLIGSADTIMVGAIGPAAISAVGITNQPKFLMLAFIITLNIGVTAIVARRKGELDEIGVNRSLKQAILLSAAISLIMTAVGIIFSRPLLLLAGAQPDFLEAAIDYFQIILVGNFFTGIGMTINAAQRGIGNTRITLRTNVAANLVNIFFNYLLINGIWIFPRLEVRGAAIATAIGNFVMLVMSFSSVINHKSMLDITRDRNWRFDERTLTGFWKVGSSSLVEQLFMRFGFFVYTALVANLGTIPYAAHNICMSLINVSFVFSDGFGIASTALVGQNLGAIRPDLATMYGKVGQRCSAVAGVFLFALFALLGKPLVSLYTTDAEVIRIGAEITVIIALTCLVQTTGVVMLGCLRGAGDSKFVAIISLITIALIRPVLSWALCYPAGLGLIGAWIGLFFDQLLRMILGYIRFSNGKWTEIKL